MSSLAEWRNGRSADRRGCQTLPAAMLVSGQGHAQSVAVAAEQSEVAKTNYEETTRRASLVAQYPNSRVTLQECQARQDWQRLVFLSASRYASWVLAEVYRGDSHHCATEITAKRAYP